MTQSKWTDHYAMLELYDPINRVGKGPESSADEIKQAHRFQIQAWAPRKFRDGSDEWQRANDRAALLNHARDVLLDSNQKATYDKEWHKHNPWFRKEREAKSTAPPEIAVRWDPPDALTNLFYNIPRGEKRTAKLIVEPRGGRGFAVEIEEPASGWLRVVEPKDRRGVPPFIAVVEVDTANLSAEQEYGAELVFVLEDS